MTKPPDDRRPALSETDTGPIGWTDEELRPKAGDATPLPHEAPTFDARDVDVTIWMRLRHIAETVIMPNSKTTIIGIIKILMGIATTILATAGINVSGGALVIAAGTGPAIIAILVGYFILSGVQAWLSQDRDGETEKTSWIGIVKIAAGVLATVLVGLGVDVSDAGVVSISALKSAPVIILYLLFIILSAVQAIYTKDREKPVEA